MDVPRALRKALKYAARKCGYNIAPRNFEWGNPINEDFPYDFTQEEIEIIKKVRPYTMTGPARVHALIRAVKHVISNDIPGDMVECGVWKGGSMMAAALTLVLLKDFSRTLYLFDTFEGMPQPNERDINLCGETAADKLKRTGTIGTETNWCRAGLDGVKEVLYNTGYDPSKMRFVQGKVEDTIPALAPEVISFLRLDTDLYESTRHELVHLYPRLASGGILILDDYGHWKGSQEAIDEYIAHNKLRVFLNRIDYCGRLIVKP